MKVIDMIRVTWDYGFVHRIYWLDKMSVTAVICERDTHDVTRLTIESLLRFYPDLPIVIVDGGSTDETLPYLRVQAFKYPNIKIWERGGRNGHGDMLHEAIMDHVSTRYVLLLDSDVIVRRGGWIEQMVEIMNKGKVTGMPIYGLGSLMLVSDEDDACGPPKGGSDTLKYIHPSCSIIDRSTYLTLPPFIEHGAPLVYNMREAQRRGLRVEYFPIDRYVMHLEGASWKEPRTIWRDDSGTMSRPFITFIIAPGVGLNMFMNMTSRDYDMVMLGQPQSDHVVIHFDKDYKVNNSLYQLRFRVQGEYVVDVTAETVICPEFINIAKNGSHAMDYPNEIEVLGVKLVKRSLWQQREALL